MKDAFDNLFQQDAHEFLNYLLNTCADILKAEMKELKELKRIEEQNRLNESLTRLNTKTHKNLHKPLTNSNHVNHSNGASNTIVNNKNSSIQSTGNNTNTNSNSQYQKSYQQNGNNSKNGSSKSLSSENSLNSNKNSNYSPHEADDLNKINLIDAASSNPQGNNNCETGAEKREELTWIHELFQGILVNETKCLNCETSSSKEENFLDLSVDVEQNTSISHCLQEFSNMEMLCGECKYYCENCCSKQEAEKRLKPYIFLF